jgi:CHAT domain-containing protein
VANPEGEESGSTLRTKLEEALANASKWESLAAAKVASTYKYVKPEDLHGVDPDEVDTKAKEVEAIRKADADRYLRQALVDRGVPEDQLDTAISALVETPKADDAAARLASLGQLNGTPPTRQAPPPRTPAEKIRAGILASPVK